MRTDFRGSRDFIDVMKIATSITLWRDTTNHHAVRYTLAKGNTVWQPHLARLQVSSAANRDSMRRPAAATTEGQEADQWLTTQLQTWAALCARMLTRSQLHQVGVRR